MDTIRWGIIGCGLVTEVKSGPAFQKAEHSELVAVMRRDAARAEDYARRHSVPRWYTNASDLINDPGVDAVYVATPPSSHANYAIEVMRAGKPVYVEKPMALNKAECREMIRVSKETGQPLFVAYYRRKLPMFLRIKELIESGAIGQVKFIDILLHKPAFPEELDPKADPGWHVKPEISGGGHFHDLAPHQLDYLEYLFGPVAESYGIAVNQAGLYEPEDMVGATIKYKNGIVASGTWCFTVLPSMATDRTVITGSKGSINFSFFNDTQFIVESGNGMKEIIDIPHPKHIQQPLIQSIVDTLRGKGTCPSTGKTAIHTTILLNKITGRDQEK